MQDKIVTKDHMNTLPLIVAVDFDGTLVEDKFPQIGEPIPENVSTLKYLQNAGIKIILHTCRDNDTVEMNLDCAVEYCKNVLGVTFDAVNKNIPEVIDMFNNDTRKVYANLYWDDKAIAHNIHPKYWVERLGLVYNEFGE